MLTDEEMKEFLLKTFNENVKSAREILYSKLSEAKNVKKLQSPYIAFLPTPEDED